MRNQERGQRKGQSAGAEHREEAGQNGGNEQREGAKRKGDTDVSVPHFVTAFVWASVFYGGRGYFVDRFAWSDVCWQR